IVVGGDGPALGDAEPEPADGGLVRGVSGDGAPGGDEPVRGAGHHEALRALRRALAGPRRARGADPAEARSWGAPAAVPLRAHLPEARRHALRRRPDP